MGVKIHMDKQKKRNLILYCFLGLLLFLTCFVIFHNIYYPQVEPLFEVKKEAEALEGYSVLVNKEDQKFIGIGVFYQPQSLSSFISKDENYELFNVNSKVYNNIYTTYDGFLVHIRVLEGRRLYFQKVYSADITMLCNGYYIRERYEVSYDEDNVDFKDENDVIEGCQDQLERIAKFYLNNEGSINKIFEEEVN